MFTRTRNLVVCCSAAAATFALAGAATAQCYFQKIVATDAATSDWFGISAAGTTISGSPTAAFGARYDNTAGGTNAGSVYVFKNSGLLWFQLSHVTADDGAASDYFGSSVGISDPYLIVGAPGAGTGGAAYIYERSGTSTWVKKTKVLPGVAASDDVGRSVSVTASNGGWALIGAPLRDIDFNPNPGTPSDPDAGVVLLCQRQANGTWTNVDTFPPHYNVNSGYYGGEHFGASVSIAGDIAVCGVPYGQNINWPANHGYIWVAHRDGSNAWSYSARLVSNNAEADDHYGAAVSTDGTYIAIGAPDDDCTAQQMPKTGAKTDSGCVYIQRYSGGTWYIDGQIFASDASDNAHFGSSVSMSNGLLVVGASGAKKSYVFKHIGTFKWVQVAVYNDPDTAASGAFGSSVAIAGTAFVVGDATDDDSVTDQGAAYAFSLPGEGMPSDSCEAATVVEAGVYNGCTSAATLDGVSTCGNAGNPQGPDVWYSWTPNCTGNIIIDTYGSSFDTVLSVHSDCPEANDSHTIQCNDDGFADPSRDSLVTFNYTPGTTYLIRVAGYNGAKGNFVLRINDYASQPNDNCVNATRAFNGPNALKNCKATIDGPLDDTACINDENIGADVWFKYTATSSGQCVVNTCGSNFDTVLMVYLGSCPNFNMQAIACNDDSVSCGGFSYQSSVSFYTASNITYYIRVGGYTPPQNTNTSVGEGFVNITPGCPCDFNGGGLSVSDIFAFLSAWFASSPAADFNGIGGINVADIFAFLSCWFGHCP